MATILQLAKSLVTLEGCAQVPGVELRHFQGPADANAWIELRNRAFARESLGVRQWSEADFRREILDKPWWSADRLWFAVAAPAEDSQLNLLLPAGERIVGAVVLADRGPQEQAQAAIHWLMVLPAWRRRGVGRLLINALECRAWELGHRRVVLETHTAWRNATQFYERLGYQDVTPGVA